MSDQNKKVIVVTGSYKGIGFEIVRSLCQHYGDKATVFMTSRDVTKAQSSLDQLKAQGLNPVLAQLDITSRSSVEKFRDLLKENYNGTIHSLINNAAMAFKVAATEPFAQQAKETVENNYFGHLLVCELLFPLLVEGNSCVINVASGAGKLGQVTANHQETLSNAKDVETVSNIMQDFVRSAQIGQQKEEGFSNSCYGMSKLGMIAVGRVHANLLAEKKIPVFNMCPGWCKSDMAGWERPPRTAAQGADTVVWLETLPREQQLKLTGKFFTDRKEMQW